MNRTQLKLAEARFFLQALEKGVGVLPDFDFYLSAFISSARSVVWVMGAEYRDTAGWQDWHDEMQVPSEIASFLASANRLRIRAVKLQSPSTSFKVDFTLDRAAFTPELEALLRGTVGHIVEVTLADTAEGVTTIIDDGTGSFGALVDSVYHTVDEFPEQDVLDVARRYVSWLDQLVRECVERFGA